MSRTILTKVDGFTPLPDLLVIKYGVMTAAVWGRVWRYCQMGDGICRASIETIAGGIGVSRMSVIRHIEILVQDGFLKDTTPNLRNRPHIYADTGKASMYNRLGIGVSESDTPASPAIPESDSTIPESDSHYTRELLEDSTKIESKKEGTTTPKNEKPDFVNITVQQAMKIKELRLFRDTTGRFPGSGQWETVWETVRAMRSAGVPVTPERLRPFWLSWSARGFSVNNLAWLTEWAVSGKIPDGRNGNGKRPAQIEAEEYRTL